MLDGGLPRWRASGYDVESSASGDAILKASAASEAIEKVYQGHAVSSQYLCFENNLLLCIFYLVINTLSLYGYTQFIALSII